MTSHVAELETFYRTVYENYIAGDKLKYAMILRRYFFNLNDCNNNKKIFSCQRRREKTYKSSSVNLKKCQSWFYDTRRVLLQCENKNKESGEKKKKKIKFKVLLKRNSSSTFTEEIQFPYPSDFHRFYLHQDKDTNHTLKSTTAEKKEKNEDLYKHYFLHYYCYIFFSTYFCKVPSCFTYGLYRLLSF